MIDTHCHLLPALDDGPRRRSEALDLARALVAAGVRAVACTPHFSRRFPTTTEAAELRLGELRSDLARAEVHLEVSLAAEVSSAYALEIEADRLRSRQLDGRHLLIELEPSTPAAAVGLIVDRLAGFGSVPVFAHPERCRAVRSQPRVLEAARAEGALIQVVAPSLAGRPSADVSGAAWGLLDRGSVDLIGTDAHRAEQAGEELATVLSGISRRFGDAALRSLTVETPALVLSFGGGR